MKQINKFSLYNMRWRRLPKEWKSLIFIFLLCTEGFAGFGQEIIVMDSITRSPVPYANLKIGESNLITDINGKYQLGNIQIGDTVKISAIGYIDKIHPLVDDQQKTIVIYLEPTSELLNIITISGSRWAERTSFQPLKIERIGKSEVKQLNPQTSADLLGNMDHVYIQKSQLGGGSPIIRGFSTSRILIAVDGIRMNNAIMRAGNVQNVLSVDPLAVESVEVSYGPGSVLYGSDAIGGVLSFYTLLPEFGKLDETNFHLNSSMRYSSANNERTLHTDFNIGSENLTWLSSVSYSDFGNLKMGSNGPDEYLDDFVVYRDESGDNVRENPNPKEQIPTAYSQLSTLHKLRWRPSKNEFFTYGFYYSELSDVPRYDRMILTSNNNPIYARWDYGPQKWLFQNLKYTSVNKNQFYDQLSVIGGHQIFQESRITRNFNNDFENIRDEKLNIFSLNLDMKKAHNGWEIYYGLEGIYNHVKSEGKSKNVLNDQEANISSRYPDSDWYSLGGYISLRRAISDNLTFHTGSRINKFIIHADFRNSGLDLPFEVSKIDFTALSGNASLTHKISKHTLNYIISTGMRAPNVDDIGKVFDSAPGNVVVPNPELKAEMAINGEINYDYQAANRLSIGGSAYYTYLNNAMVRRDYSLSGMDSIVYDGAVSKIQAVQNASSAYVSGIQIGLDYYLSEYWKIKGSYNIQKGQEETDDGIKSNSRHIVPNYGRLLITHKNPLWFYETGLNYQGGVSYNDLPLSERDKPDNYAKDDDGNPYSPSWWTLNIRAGININESLQIYSGIENVLDKRYRPYSSGISASGINFYVNVNYAIN